MAESFFNAFNEAWAKQKIAADSYTTIELQLETSEETEEISLCDPIKNNTSINTEHIANIFSTRNFFKPVNSINPLKIEKIPQKNAKIKLNKKTPEHEAMTNILKKYKNPSKVFTPQSSKTPRYLHLREPTPTKPPPPLPAVNLKFESNADLVWDAGFQKAFQLLKIDECEGIQEQISSGLAKEVVIGLDFGTSSVKLVLGDRGAGKAYAVPFVEATGVDSYLLPSRVFETDGVFSLSQGLTAHRDLKLRFLANTYVSPLQETLAGFLGLVIRRCRAWLFVKHADTFANRNLLWKLVLGRVADRAMNDEVGKVMSRIAAAAWTVAGQKGPINRKACASALLLGQDKTELSNELLELSVVPELVAQIYGFVSSRQFDPKAKNFYLIVDVGAGTVDVSLFRVKPTALGTLDVSLFNSVVEPNGVVNLHRTRLKWWSQQFMKLNNDTAGALIQKLQSIRTPTEQTLPIPEQYKGYFKGLKVEFLGSAVNPDDDFYINRLVHQVRGKGIHNPINSKIVGKVDIANLCFFLCGGGSRLPLYRKLSQALHQAPGWQWLQAEPRYLRIPGDLVAPGLLQADYDRLSVAYGLSFVDVGNFAVAQAMPVVNQKSEVDWQSRYLDKDQC